MKPTGEQLENLLALKRYERPQEGYWQDFLCEFHECQRELAVKKADRSSALNRAFSWLASLGPTKWAYGAGIAYAACVIGFLFTSRNAEVERAVPSPVHYQVSPPPATTTEPLPQLKLKPVVPANASEQEF